MPPPSATFASYRRFGIVIDAGSSGSRILVYSWIKPEVERDRRLQAGETLEVLTRVEKGVEEGDDWFMRTQPGISSFGPNPSGVRGHLQPLLEHARSLIPPSQILSTPIYLLATAGMRLLPDDQRHRVLGEACKVIKEYGFEMRSGCGEHVRVITGEEEGLYGWVAVNYLMDGFDAHLHEAENKGKGKEKMAAIDSIPGGSSTFGFLDMGGASTQIAFEPSAEQRILHADNLSPIRLRLLNGREVEHGVFVTTWLGYGTNQARERYIDRTIERFISGQEGDRTEEELSSDGKGLGSERPVLIVEDPCLPNELLLSEARHPGYTLRGTGDWQACLRLTEPLLNKSAPCPDEPCLFNGVHVPPIDFNVNHFIGISEYWYATQDVFGLGGVYDVVEFERKAMQYCGMSWPQILKDHNEPVERWQWRPRLYSRDGQDLSRLEMQCFKAAWLVNILHEGIGIPRIGLDQGDFIGDGMNHTEEGIIKAGEKGLGNAPPSFQSLNEVGGVAISWTLGRMVLDVSRTVSSRGGSHTEAEWIGHIPSWGKGITSTIGTTILSLNPFVFLAIAIIMFALWLLCFNARGKARLSSYMPLTRRPRSHDYALSSMEEGDGNSRRTRLGPISLPAHPSGGFLSKIMAPLRMWRIRKWGRRGKGISLPLVNSRSPDSPNRPRIPRAPYSSPSTFRSGDATSEPNGHTHPYPHIDTTFLMPEAKHYKKGTPVDPTFGGLAQVLSTQSSSTSLRPASSNAPSRPSTPHQGGEYGLTSKKGRAQGRKGSTEGFLTVPLNGMSTPPDEGTVTPPADEPGFRPASRSSSFNNLASLAKRKEGASDDMHD